MANDKNEKVPTEEQLRFLMALLQAENKDGEGSIHRIDENGELIPVKKDEV